MAYLSTVGLHRRFAVDILERLKVFPFHRDPPPDSSDARMPLSRSLQNIHDSL